MSTPRVRAQATSTLYPRDSRCDFTAFFTSSSVIRFESAARRGEVAAARGEALGRPCCRSLLTILLSGPTYPLEDSLALEAPASLIHSLADHP